MRAAQMRRDDNFDQPTNSFQFRIAEQRFGIIAPSEDSAGGVNRECWRSQFFSSQWSFYPVLAAPCDLLPDESRRAACGGTRVFQEVVVEVMMLVLSCRAAWRKFDEMGASERRTLGLVLAFVNPWQASDHGNPDFGAVADNVYSIA